MLRKVFQKSLIVFSISAATGFSACSDGSNSAVPKVSNANQIVVVNNNPVNSNIPTATPAAVVNSAPSNAAVSPAVNSSGMNKKNAAPPAQTSTPIASTGASDFLVFTQIRGALNADKEFTTAVIVEIKEGNVVLNGTVSSAEQKAKAEQLVKSVNGVKSIKNNLKVS